MGSDVHYAYLNKCGNVVREPSLIGNSLIHYLAYEWWSLLDAKDETIRKGCYYQYLIEPLKFSTEHCSISSPLVGQIPPASPLEGSRRASPFQHAGYQNWFQGLMMENALKGIDEDYTNANSGLNSWKLQVLDSGTKAEEPYSNAMLDDDYRSGCRLFETFAIPLGSILHKMIPYGIRWSIQWAHPLFLETYIKLGLTGITEERRNSLIFDLNICASHNMNAVGLARTLPVQIDSVGLPATLERLLSCVASSVFAAAMELPESNSEPEHLHICTPLIAAVNACKTEYGASNLAQVNAAPKQNLSCEFWGSLADCDYMMNNIMFLMIASMVTTAQALYEGKLKHDGVSEFHSNDYVSWYINKLDRLCTTNDDTSDSLDSDAKCVCFTSKGRKGKPSAIIVFDEDQHSNNDVILAKQMTLLKSRRERISSTKLPPKKFSIWSSEWYHYLDEHDLLNHRVLGFLMRAVRIAVGGFQCELSTRANHNSRESVCRWRHRFVSETLTDRLKLIFDAKNNPEIFENAKIQKILALQDGIYDYLCEHTKYNSSLVSSVWEDGPVSKFNFSIFCVNDITGNNLNDVLSTIRDAHPFSMYGHELRDIGKPVHAERKITNIAAEHFIVPDDSAKLNDPRRLLDRLVTKGCNQVEKMPSAAINTLWEELNKVQSVQDSHIAGLNTAVERQHPMDDGTGVAGGSGKKSKNAPNRARTKGLHWNHGIAITVLRDEPLIRPFHGVQLQEKNASTVFDKMCGAAWNHTPSPCSDDVVGRMNRHMRKLNEEPSTRSWSNRTVAGWGTDVTQTVLLNRRYVCPLPHIYDVLGLPKKADDRFSDGNVHDVSFSDMAKLTEILPVEFADLYRLKYGSQLHEPVVHLHQAFPSKSFRPVSMCFNLDMLVNDIAKLENYRLHHRLFAGTLLKDLVQTHWPNAKFCESEYDSPKGEAIDADGVQYTCMLSQYAVAKSHLNDTLLPSPSEWVAKGPGGGPCVVVATMDNCRLGECVKYSSIIRNAGIPCQWRQMAVKDERAFRKYIERCPSVIMILFLMKRRELPHMVLTRETQPLELTEEKEDDTMKLEAEHIAMAIARKVHMTNNLQTGPDLGPFKLVTFRDPRDYNEFANHVTPSYCFHQTNNFKMIEVHGTTTADHVYSRRGNTIQDTVQHFDTFGPCCAEIRRTVRKNPELRRLRATLWGM